MHFIFKSKIFVLFNVLVFLVMLLSLNYSVGNYISASEDRPFHLSRNYEVYEKVQMKKNGLKSFLNNKESDYVMILETHDKETIGIYDPMMHYYLKSFKVSAPNLLRYFSKEDYIKERNVGICIDGCSLFDFTYLETLGKELNLEVINCFENSPLAVNDIIIVHNLFSMEEHIGDYIYIDSTNQKTIHLLDEQLKNIGYQKLNKTKKTSVDLLSALKFGLESKHSFYLLFSNLMLLVLTSVTSYIYFEKMKKRIILNFFYGCTISKFLKMFFLPYFLIMMLSNIIIIGILYLIMSELLYLSLCEYIIVILVDCLFLMAIYSINFIKVYQEIKKGYRL